MHTILPFILSFTLLLTNFYSPSIEAKCPKPPQGPPGPRGPAGSLATNYASVWSTTAQEIPPTTNPVDVIFENNQLAAAGITHPASGDQSVFEIQNNGVYLIIWNVTTTYVADDPNEHADVNFELVNAANNTAFNPGFNGSAALSDGDALSITGQTTLRLPAGTQIQLRVRNNRSIVEITNRTLTITQIAL